MNGKSTVWTLAYVPVQFAVRAVATSAVGEAFNTTPRGTKVQRG